MMDHTNTLWVVMLTGKKNMLTKISRLKRFGKLKIEEIKILYGKKSVGGWTFRINVPGSKTFSFHDGEVIQRSQGRYILLRKYGSPFYGVFLGLMLTYLCVTAAWAVFQRNSKPEVVPEVTSAVKVVKPVKPSLKKAKGIEKKPPQITRGSFLEAKKMFQSGKFTACLKIIKRDFDFWNLQDQTQANSMVSEMHFVQCKKWIQQSEERKAVVFCEKALKFSSHEKALAFLNTQEEKAKRLYLEGYTIQKFDPAIARAKYEQVLQAARSKSTWRGKAAYQVRKMKKSNGT